MDKVSVGILQSGQGRQMINDPFDAAYAYEKARTRKIERRRAKLEEERLTREYMAQQEMEKEAKANANATGAGAGAGGGFGGEQKSEGPSFRQRKAYRAAADKVKEVWSQGTGVKMDQLKRRRWSDSGSTIPLERSIVPFGVSVDDLYEDFDDAVAAVEEEVPVSR